MTPCIVTIQERRVHCCSRVRSISGAQRNLNIHGRTRVDVSRVMYSTDTPWLRRVVGSAHQMNPIGAPSLKYKNVNRTVRPRGVPSGFTLF